MCRNLSHRELLNMSHTVSASATRCCPHPAPARRCLGTARLRHACARHFNVQSAAPKSTASRAEHAHFLPRLNGSKTLFLRFIILYNSPYAVLFIATHAKHCTPPICCAVLRNQLKSYKNTRLFIVAFLFAYLLHVFCKVFQHILLLAALHQITKMAKAFLLCSAKRIGIRSRAGNWSLDQAILSFSAIFNLLANGMVSKSSYVWYLSYIG